VDDKILVSNIGAPQLGEHNEAIEKQFELEKQLIATNYTNEHE
jgi:hypothetical protein